MLYANLSVYVVQEVIVSARWVLLMASGGMGLSLALSKALFPPVGFKYQPFSENSRFLPPLTVYLLYAPTKINLVLPLKRPKS